MRRLAKATATGMAAAGIGALLALTPPGMALEERFGLSWLFWLRGPVAAPDEVVVVSLDRQSAERLGHSAKIREWPRALYARLVERLSEADASVVVLDLIFDRERGDDPAQDAELADAIARAGRVVLLEKLDQIRREMQSGDAPVMVTTEQVIQPVKPLAQAAAGLAPFPLPAGERVSQFWTFKVAGGGRPTLPVIALQQFALSGPTAWLSFLEAEGLPLASALPEATDSGRGALELGELTFLLRQTFRNDPTLAERLYRQLAAADLDGGQRRLLEALIGAYGGPDHRYLNFYGPAGHLRTIPVHEILAEEDAGRGALGLAGRAVFVGQSENLNVHADRFPTVFSDSEGIDLSGVEIAATAFANLLKGDLLEPAALGPSIAALVGFGLATGLAAGLLPSLLALPACLLIGLGYALGVELAFAHSHRWFPIAIPLLVQLPFGLFLGLLMQYLAAQQARRNLSHGARYYLPEKVVAGLAEAPLEPETSSDLVYAACMVADAERFTSFAEQMAPRDLNTFLNRHFEALFAVVERNGGLVTDVVGDGMTAVWSAPAPDARARARACRAALEIDRAVLDFEPTRGALRTRIGIHAGMVMLGNVGGSGRFAYSVIGDSVNTAARIESLNKQLGTRVLATGAVAGDLCDFIVRPLGRFQLFGKQEALPIFEILGFSDDAVDARALASFSEALACFADQQWQKAARKFEAILAEHPADGPAKFYAAHCRRHQNRRPVPRDPDVVRLHHK